MSEYQIVADARIAELEAEVKKLRNAVAELSKPVDFYCGHCGDRIFYIPDCPESVIPQAGGSDA